MSTLLTKQKDIFKKNNLFILILTLSLLIILVIGGFFTYVHFKNSSSSTSKSYIQSPPNSNTSTNIRKKPNIPHKQNKNNTTKENKNRQNTKNVDNEGKPITRGFVDEFKTVFKESINEKIKNLLDAKITINNTDNESSDIRTKLAKKMAEMKTIISQTNQSIKIHDQIKKGVVDELKNTNKSGNIKKNLLEQALKDKLQKINDLKKPIEKKDLKNNNKSQLKSKFVETASDSIHNSFRFDPKKVKRNRSFSQENSYGKLLNDVSDIGVQKEGKGKGNVTDEYYRYKYDNKETIDKNELNIYRSEVPNNLLHNNDGDKTTDASNKQSKEKDIETKFDKKNEEIYNKLLVETKIIIENQIKETILKFSAAKVAIEASDSSEEGKYLLNEQLSNHFSDNLKEIVSNDLFYEDTNPEEVDISENSKLVRKLTDYIGDLDNDYKDLMIDVAGINKKEILKKIKNNQNIEGGLKEHEKSHEHEKTKETEGNGEENKTTELETTEYFPIMKKKVEQKVVLRYYIAKAVFNRENEKDQPLNYRNNNDIIQDESDGLPWDVLIEGVSGWYSSITGY